MKRFVLSFAALLLSASSVSLLFAHCEIPCGIYNDQMRVTLLEEHITTVEKSMQQIQELSDQSDALSLNQAVRWIENKDSHAGKIQEIVTQYFLTQRVKVMSDDDPDYNTYLKQVTSLHQMMVSAMKCKQTLDLDEVEKLRSQLKKFKRAYFSAEDLKHMREHTKEHDTEDK